METSMKHLKNNYATYLIIVAVIGGILTWFNVPGKVEAMEQEIYQNQQHLGNLTKTVDIYIQVQSAKEEMQERREELLLNLIEKMNK